MKGTEKQGKAKKTQWQAKEAKETAHALQVRAGARLGVRIASACTCGCIHGAAEGCLQIACT